MPSNKEHGKRTTGETMRIASVCIKNLRSFASTTVPFNGYTCLVGPNGSGKSTILCALNIFFREKDNATTDLSQLDREDFHQKNTNDPIEVTITFEDLSGEAQQDFADYYRQGKLIVSAVATFNAATGKAEVKQYGQRLGISAFKDFFRAVGDGAKVTELKELYATIRQNFDELPSPGSKDAMIAALHAFEAQHPELCELIPSEDQFYGLSKGANRLAKYVQWVYVPAVKDAATEQMEAKNTALGKLLARTVRAKTNFGESVEALRTDMQSQYQDLLNRYQHVLQELTESLKSRLTEWAHPEAMLKLEWRQDPEKSVRVEEPLARIIAGEGGFEGDLARFGHGLQRSYLLALLHELASSDDASAPRLILGCEEPELYQHPPQARHLAAVLQELSKGNSQVIVSTHSPLFVSGEGFEDVRMVRKDHNRGCSNVSFMSYSEIADAITSATEAQPVRPEGILAKIHQALQPTLNEMFFATRLILVEGLEDVAYITTYLNLLGRWDEYRRLGCHIVPVDKKSALLQPLLIARHMGIPTFVVFDSDADKPDRNGSRVKHENDNKALLKVIGQPAADPMPGDTLRGVGFTMWRSDLTTVIADDIGIDDWQRYQNEADRQYGHAGDLKKHSLHIATSLNLAWNDGKRSSNLERLCANILDPACSISTNPPLEADRDLRAA